MEAKLAGKSSETGTKDQEKGKPEKRKLNEKNQTLIWNLKITEDHEEKLPEICWKEREMLTYTIHGMKLSSKFYHSLCSGERNPWKRRANFAELHVQKSEEKIKNG